MDAGTANDKIKPRVTQGILCHQTGMICTPQRGQTSYGRPNRLLNLKSAMQSGQTAQGVLSIPVILDAPAIDEFYHRVVRG
jgi:hypothetical protein